jgi:hypothetical protein
VAARSLGFVGAEMKLAQLPCKRLSESGQYDCIDPNGVQKRPAANWPVKGNTMSNDNTKMKLWGGCPVCMKHGTFRNVGKDNFICCDDHKVFWRVGSGLFPETLGDPKPSWEANKALLETYTDVEEEVLRMRQEGKWEPFASSE